MLASELIKALENIIMVEGDKELVFETNRHKYSSIKPIYRNSDNKIIMPLYGKTDLK